MSGLPNLAGPSKIGRASAMESLRLEDVVPRKPLEVRELTREEREERVLALKQAREKADAEKVTKFRPLPAKKK